jgi:SpoVK/Ycf46/Vps4 family AAA+-type ATPase
VNTLREGGNLAKPFSENPWEDYFCDRYLQVNLLPAFLSLIDSLEGVLLIGLTNHQELVDPALLRRGRFDMAIPIDLPDVAGRKAILRIHTQSMLLSGCLAPNVDLEEIARQTEKFTGAEIEALVRAASTAAIRRRMMHLPHHQTAPQKIRVEMEDFRSALRCFKTR